MRDGDRLHRKRRRVCHPAGSWGDAMRPTRKSLVSISYVLVAIASGSALAAPPPPEYGLDGVQRLELVFVNLGWGGVRGGIVRENAVTSPGLPQDDLEDRDLSSDPECKAIPPDLSREGIEVVARCRYDDAACAKLLLTAETTPVPKSDDRAYVATVELSQRVQLARDPTVDLTRPTTWSSHRFGVVAAHNSASRTVCIAFRDQARSFGTEWKLRNR